MKKNTLIKYIVKMFILSIVGIIFLLTLSFILFSLNKDKISSTILLKTNNYTQGNIQFKDIQFNPYVQFPSISLSLEDVKYYENDKALNNSLPPICNLQYMHIAIDFLDLFKNKITISKVLLENGVFNIISYTDTSSNIKNAITPINHSAKKDSTIKNKNDLLLDKIILKNISINYTTQKNTKTSISITDLESYLSIKSDTIIALLNTNLHFNKIPIKESENIIKNDIYIKSSVLIDTKLLNINIRNGDILFDKKIKFGINGSLNLGKKKKIDIVFNASNSQMGLFELLLNEYDIEKITQGSIYANGSIKGDLQKHIPMIKLDFGIQNLTIDIPQADNYIQDFNLLGSFSSGIKPDLSDAYLSIDTITSLLPNGYINGYLNIKNFKKMDLDYFIDMKADIKYLDDILNMNKIDSLDGYVSIFSKKNKSTDDRKSTTYSSISFDSLYFNIPNIMEFNGINGNITGDIDTLCINNLDLLIGNSDLNINGEIYDLSNMLDTNNNDFTTNLTINSNLLDLADLLSFKENVGRGFPYQITDLYINLTANTNREKFKSTPVPDINFDIHRLDCNANKLVPPVTIKDLKFRLGDLDGSLYLTFNDFKAIFSTGTLSGDVTYHEPYLQTPYLEVDALINNFDLMNFFYTKKGKLKKPPYSYLNGDAYCKLFFSTDTSTIFSKVDFSSSKLSYSTDSANLQITNLKINSDYVNYNSYYIKNPLATLTTDIDIKAKKLKYNNIDVNSFWYNIMANDGKYTLTPKKSWLYANDVSGTIAISPFNKPFDINIDMSIKKLNLEKSLNMVIKDSAIMKGDIDIDINISSSSDSISRIKNNINGNVDISGEKLALIGIDIDQILSDIDRSQHFNLIDLGGVLLAGPIGLLFTKGSDYTRILLSDHSQTTIINKFISNWEISNSVFKIDDFAFNSKENLVATKGELNLVSDSLDFTIAIVNDKGCSKVSQRIAGPTTAPQIGKMVIVKTLIAPVTNLMKIESNCKPFYTGSVKYPDIKE